MFKLSGNSPNIIMFGVTLPLVMYMYVSRDILKMGIVTLCFTAHHSKQLPVLWLLIGSYL